MLIDTRVRYQVGTLGASATRALALDCDPHAHGACGNIQSALAPGYTVEIPSSIALSVTLIASKPWKLHRSAPGCEKAIAFLSYRGRFPPAEGTKRDMQWALFSLAGFQIYTGVAGELLPDVAGWT